MEEQNQEPITRELFDAERSRADQSEERAKQSDARAQQFEDRLKSFVADRELELAAQRAGAFHPAQLVAILKQRAQATPALGEDGTPTGEYEVRIISEGGEPLTPRQAIERLRETDSNFFLAKSEVRVDDSQKSNESPKEMMARLARTNPAKYRELRAKHPEYLGLKRRDSR